MAYTPITSQEIAAGQPVNSTTLNTIKNDLSDHETRLISVEAGGAVAYPPIIMRVNGNYSQGGIVSAILKTTCNFNLDINGIRLIVDQAGNAGTTEVDVKFKRGAGAYTSVLTTKPSVSYTVGNDGVSTNGVISPTYKSLLAGDIISLDITSVQGGGSGFLVRIDFTKVA